MALEEAATADATKDTGASPDAAAKDGAAAAAAAAGKAGAATEGKGTDAAADGKTVDSAAVDADADTDTSLFGDEDEGDDATGADDKAEPDGKATADAADKGKKAPDWSTMRLGAIDRAMKAVEGQLAKKLTAADLPKELAKRRSAMEKQLGRYASLDDALIAGFHAQEKIRTGQVKQPLAEDASEEERTAWRKDNGIPEAAQAYDIPKVAGHQWSEAANVALNERYKPVFHKANLTQAQVNEIVTAYAKDQQAALETHQQAVASLDREDRDLTRRTLRDELEADYRPGVTLMERYLNDPDVFRDGLGDVIKKARTEDGRRLVFNPNFAKLLIENARSTYGEGAMITGQVAEAVATEEAEIEKLMQTDISAYHNQPWKSTGKTAAERYDEITRKKASKGRAA